MPPAAPSKRRLSEISVPPLPSSQSHASSEHQHGHGHNHPFGNPMHLFHRGRGKQPRPQPEERTGAAKVVHEQRVHFMPPAQQPQPARARQQPNSEMAYVPPAMHGGAAAATAASKLAAMDATRAVVPSKPTSKPSKPSNGSSAASSASAPAANEWRQARCPRTGKPYYWNARTRESRWKKPLALASAEERAAIENKERAQKEFFEGMERNILRRLEEGKREREAAGKAEEARGMVSPGNDGIDRSWTQADTSSPTEGTEAGIDQSWISGWITPGSGGDPARSPTGSLSSTEGLSVVTPGSTGSTGSGLSREERDDKLYPLQKPSRIQRIKSSSQVIDKPDLIRTISKMEYDLVHQLNPALAPAKASAKASAKPLRIHADHRSVGPGANGTCGMDLVPLTPTTQTCDILSSLRLTLGADGLDVSLDSLLPGSGAVTPTSPMTPASLEPTTPGNESSPNERSMSSPNTTSTEPIPREGMAKPSLTKRNTCGTIYLGSTLAAPDKDALIQCVCGVYRAHLLQANATAAANCHTGREDPHEIFRDRRAPGDYRPLDVASVPALAQITDFYRSVFLRSQMEVDCIVISLIYVERLIKLTSGALKPCANNWRSVLFSCMVLASKVWDDLSMWNGDFSKIGPAGVTFSLARTNELEVALLRALAYRVKVGAGEYAKYYFLLRGMLCRSGLANDDLAKMQPLDVQGARTLEGLDVARTTLDASPGAAATGDKAAVAVGELKERSKSYGDMGASAHGEAGKFQDDARGGAIRAAPATGAAPPQPSPRSSPASKRVSLEQIVRM